MSGTNYNAKLDNNVKAVFTDDNGNITRAECDGNPNVVATMTGFVTGCEMLRTDFNAGNNLYQNTGSLASPTWTLISAGGGGGSPAAPNTSVQFNNAGAFGGNANFTRDPATGQTIIYDNTGFSGLIINVNGANLASGGSSVNLSDSGIGDAQADITVAGFKAFYSSQTTPQIVQIGDTGNNFNSNVFVVDDAAQIMTAIYTNAFYFQTVASDVWGVVDNGNTIVQWGDVNQVVNKTLLTVDDDSQLIRAEMQGSFLVRDANNASALYMYVNVPNRVAAIGDINTQGNGSRIYIDDVNLRTDIYTQNLYVRGYNGNVSIFAESTVGYHNVQIGDCGLVTNKTMVWVEDSAKYIHLKTDEKIEVISSTGVQGSYIDFVGRDYALGNLSGAGNHNLIWIEDDNDIISARTPGLFQVTDTSNVQWLVVDIGNSTIAADSHTGTFLAGDVNGAGNNFKFVINDAASFYQLSGLGGGGTQFVTVDNSGVLGTQSITLSSGTYTPTLTNVTNITASTAYECQYMRVGNTVTVSGKVDIDPTAFLATELGITLPIASNLGAEEDCAGTASCGALASVSASISGDAGNNRAALKLVVSASLANQSYFFTFTYQII